MATTSTPTPTPSRREKLNKAGQKVFGTISNVNVNDHIFARLVVAELIILVITYFALFAAGMAGDYAAYTFPTRMGQILALALVVYVICFAFFTKREGWKQPWPQLILIVVLALIVFFLLPFWLRIAAVLGIAQLWWSVPLIGYVVSIVSVWLLFKLVFRLCTISTTDSTITSANQAVIDRKAEYDALSAQYEGHKSTFEKAKKKAEKLQDKKAEIDLEANTAGVENSEAQEAFDKMVARDTTVEAAQEAVNTARGKVTDLGGNQKSLEKDYKRANVAIEPYEGRLDDLKIEITQAEQARDAAEAKLDTDELAVAKKDASSTYSLAQSRLDALIAEQRKVTSLFDSKDRKFTQLEGANRLLDAAKSEFKKTEAERDEAQKALNGSTPEGKRLTAATTAFEAITARQADAKKELDIAENARDEAKSLMTSASNAREDYDKKTNKKKAKLEEVNTTAQHSRKTWWFYTVLFLIAVLATLPAFYGWVLTQHIH